MAWTMGYLLKGHLVSLRYWGDMHFSQAFSHNGLALECTDQTQRDKCVVCRVSNLS